MTCSETGMYLLKHTCVNHDSTGVASGVSLAKTLELEYEQNMGKTDDTTQK